MSWSVPRIWEGGDVWIIGGGPSIPVQFGIPDRVVRDVINGTSSPNVYSPYLSYLHDKHVIGINAAYLIGDWIDMIFFGDNGFFLGNKEGLAKFPGLKISCNPGTEKYNWTKFLPRDRNHTRGISPGPRSVSWNQNSGAAAISVAYHTGAKRIFLLGFDMKLNEQDHSHWHNQYKKPIPNPRKKKAFTLPFDRHLSSFPMIAADAKRLGVEIINVCPDSRITQFPKTTMKEIMQ